MFGRFGRNEFRACLCCKHYGVSALTSKNVICFGLLSAMLQIPSGRFFTRIRYAFYNNSLRFEIIEQAFYCS